MEIPYKIKKIETNEFASFPENYSRDGKSRIQIGFEFSVSSIQPIIRCKAVFTDLNTDQKPTYRLVLSCYFMIESKAYQNMSKDNNLTIPVGFLRYMATIAVGTARGVLHAKMERSVMSDYVLPPINLVQMIKEDYVTGLNAKK